MHATFISLYNFYVTAPFVFYPTTSTHYLRFHIHYLAPINSEHDFMNVKSWM